MLTRPVVLLKLENLCLLVAAVELYRHLHFGWLLFGVLFLAPDLSMLGYAVNPRIGSALYNLAHTYVGPSVLLAAACLLHIPVLSALSLIWISHIAFDRPLGYGLKYPTHFKDTHLQRISS